MNRLGPLINDGYRRCEVLLLVLCCLLLSGCERASTRLANYESMPLYAGAAPGSENWNIEEVSGFNSVTDVSRPSLILLPAPVERSTGQWMIVCPGGGFTGLSVIKEGLRVARWLNERGISAAILKYRVRRPDASNTKEDNGADFDARARRLEAGRQLAVADGLQAMRVLREHAELLKVDPDAIGIMGFSAGAMVSMSVVLASDEITMPALASAIYGAMPPVPVPAFAPPVFLVHAQDDPLVPVDKTVEIQRAWQEAGVSVETHIFESGGHGFGAESTGHPTDDWMTRWGDWLQLQQWGLASASG